MPTSSASGTGIAAWPEPRRISDRTPGAILQPQPPPWESEVSRGSSVRAIASVVVIGFPLALVPAGASGIIGGAGAGAKGLRGGRLTWRGARG